MLLKDKTLAPPLRALSGVKSHLKAKTIGLKKSEDGLAAIEFALLAPLLITMYFGLAEVATAVAVNRAVSHATNIAGDLTTQSTDIDAAELEDVLTATLRVMAVPEASKVTIQIDSWTRDTDGNDTLVGSATMNPGAASLPSFNIAKVDSSLLNENSGIVVARIGYKYAPFKAMFFENDINMKETFMLKPRRSSKVTFGSSEGKTYSCTSSGNTAKCN
ncbi:TadE-like protein [Litorimonas taeanensis]|uniref:TadE-like protein n=1 Tax=Litorimonas taeanensis TaxID=568099 RepID=A0A420WMF0_9PROT|nr:TadE/TadG family type IV pilus assembly protein [Litorimonas taeanensis]RKQ72076.1 TadE-like protein [Litorimonas taeanensis]